MSNRIQFRRDTKARWTEVNPVLMEGEIGLETDTHNIKMGDGTHAWNNLEYIVGYDNLTNEVGSSENLAISQKGFTEIVKGIKDGMGAYDFPMIRISDFNNNNWDGFNNFLDNLDFSDKKYIGHCKLSISGRNFDLYNYIFAFNERIGVQVIKGGVTIKSDGKLTAFDGYKILYRNVNNGVCGEWIDCLDNMNFAFGFSYQDNKISKKTNYQNSSISLKITENLNLFSNSGGSIVLPVMSDYIEIPNNKSLFFNLLTNEYIVDWQASKHTPEYVLLLFNRNATAFSGILSKNDIFSKLESLEFNDVSQKSSLGFNLSDEIIYGAARAHTNGELVNLSTLDCTPLIEIPYNSSYLNISRGPIYSLTFFDKDKKFIGYQMNLTKINKNAKYLSISFLKTEKIDYSNLHIMFSDEFNHKICSDIGMSIFGLYYGKAYQTVSGELVNLSTLDCTPLIEVPSNSSLNLSISSKFYEIACFGKDNAYLGATHTPNTALKNGTKYFSISFLKTDNIDYNDVKISLQPTYSFQEIAVPKNGKIYYLFGDSITYWDDRTSWYDENVKMVAYPSYIRSVLKCTAINKGVAGNTASQITKRLLSTNLSDAYAVTYMAGANDLQSSIRIGEVGTLDDTTYIGNLSKAVEYVLKSYPYVKFYFLAPLWTNKGNIKPYAEAMESVAKYYNVPILRWDLTSCLNSMTADTYYVNEGTTRLHPNNIGHARLADSLIPFLQNY